MSQISRRRALLLALSGLPGAAALSAAAPAAGTMQQNAHKFDFGADTEAAPGYTKVTPETAYTKERGYGFEPDGAVPAAVTRGGVKDRLRADLLTSEKPFLFSVAAPEGNYRVTVTLGDAAEASDTTVKAESRRLMLEGVRTAPGKFEQRTFTVNVRTERIATGGAVRLKTREMGVLHWDDKLTLEFNGTRPAVCAVEIAPAPPDTVTVYLAGDSTVTDQPREPWNSWGQMLTRFFGPGVAVANHAESGESLNSFVSQRRWDKVLSTIKKGDYLFVQFGHNDMKEKGEGVGAFTTYRASLKKFVAEARARGANPVLVTPMHRRRFTPDGKVQDTLGDYPEAVRQAAKEENVPLIDLHTMSRKFYEALGPEKSALAFQDGTHHNAYGSYELARCIVEGIRQNRLDLAKYLAKDAAPFDPARPDPVEAFAVPASAAPPASEKPDGS